MVWDIWIRTGHWLVVGLIAFQFYSGDQLDLRDQHAWAGITLLSWWLFRFVWGFLGPQHAQFKDFVAGPARVCQSFFKLFKRQPEPVAGHTHAGGLGVVLILGLILGLGLTGLISTDDVFYDAPLNYLVSSDTASWAMRIHHWLGEALILVIVGHLTAIFWHQRVMGERLIQGMIHGRKAAGIGTIKSAVTLRGGLIVIASAALVMGSLWQWGAF